MKTSSIICEFNPFHNGHKYLIDKTRENGADIIVGIMSGNFTQRGDVAILSKYCRAKSALKNGIDLIVELPVVFACSTAERFAKAGIQIADALCCDELSFGSESGSINDILKAAKAVNDKKINLQVNNMLKCGEYYPKALETAVRESYGDDIAGILSKPNNILGVEYCKALINKNIKPFTVKRAFVEHDSSNSINNYASASHIRNLLLNSDIKANSYMPDNSEILIFDKLHSISYLERAILYKLRSMKADDFRKLPDVRHGLENRIVENIRNYNSLNEIIDNIKTKRYTHARIRRIIIYSLLGITEHLQSLNVPYIRVLGFNNKGANILSNTKKKNALPIITKISKAYNNLTDSAKRILDIDILASDIYALSSKNIESSSQDYYQEIIKV